MALFKVMGELSRGAVSPVITGEEIISGSRLGSGRGTLQTKATSSAYSLVLEASVDTTLGWATIGTIDDTDGELFVFLVSRGVRFRVRLVSGTNVSYGIVG